MNRNEIRDEVERILADTIDFEDQVERITDMMFRATVLAVDEHDWSPWPPPADDWSYIDDDGVMWVCRGIKAASNPTREEFYLHFQKHDVRSS